MDPLGGKKIDRFRGVVTNADASDLPDGALAEGDNVESHQDGRLVARKGFVRAIFTNETGSPASGKKVIALHRHHFGISDTYLYQLDDGTIHVGLGAITT